MKLQFDLYKDLDDEGKEMAKEIHASIGDFLLKKDKEAFEHEDSSSKP